MSKEIEIKKTHVKNLFLSFLIGFLTLYGLEHFGKFSYLANSPTTYDEQGRAQMISYIPYNTKISSLIYNTFFGESVTTSGNGFDIADVNFKDTDFDKYSVKSYYYTQATLIDFKYGIYISLGLFLTMLFFSIFKFKFS